MFWVPDGEYWTHEGDNYLLDHNIWTHSTLGEPLDLALALINIDDPDVYVRVALTPMPKRSQRSGQRQENWRGGFHRDFQVLRIRAGQPTQELLLDAETKKRFEAGFLGWAMHEGHEVIDDRALTSTEALIPRDLRRASQHLLQVEAIMNGVDPRDKELLRGFRA
jgi:transcriptional regulator GlxA family with amidase domain